jgi:hypothetical protein
MKPGYLTAPMAFLIRENSIDLPKWIHMYIYIYWIFIEMLGETGRLYINTALTGYI